MSRNYFVTHVFRHFVGIFGTLLLVAGISIGLSQQANADDKRFVTVYVDNTESLVATSATTVGEVLERLDIDILENDYVEPGVDNLVDTDTYNINVYRARPVTVIDGSERFTVMSPYQTSFRIAKEAGLDVREEDKFDLERIDNFVAEGSLGLKLTITRAKKVNVTLYGSQFEMYTHASNVADLISERGIVVGSSDLAYPAVETPIHDGLELAIMRVGQDVIVGEESVPYPQRTIRDSAKDVGYEEVQTPGVDGAKMVTYKVTYHDGTEQSRNVIQEVVTTEPVEEVVVIGTKVAVASAPSDPGDNQAIGQRLAAERGWEGAQWDCLYQLWAKESRWNHLAANSHSGAYGIPQSLPGSKMASVASDWQTNPVTQITWGLNYVGGRYGSPCGAWEHFVLNNWY